MVDDWMMKGGAEKGQKGRGKRGGTGKKKGHAVDAACWAHPYRACVGVNE